MKKANTAIAVLTLALSSSANAGMVTSWTYINEAGFVDVLPSTVNQSDPQTANVLSVDTFKNLNWGIGTDGFTDPSSLSVNSPQSGTITTVASGTGFVVGDYEQGTGLTHNNYPITGGGALTTATILDGIRLQIATWDLPASVPTVGFTAPELSIGFDFFETNNNPGGLCPDGSVAGTDPSLSGYGCDDYFIIKQSFLDSVNDIVNGTDFISFSVMFDILDNSPPEFAVYAEANDFLTTYEITTRFSGLEISTEFCGDAVAPCLALRTNEAETNNLEVDFAIRGKTINVPEPSTLGLLGLSLIGLRFSRRSRKS
jgi:hypothetical protein